MPIVRQLPQVYLRGSLANITMANLTQDQTQHVATVVDFVVEHDEMKQRRNKFISNLSHTIGADYADREAADQEYKIAIWRATVDLLYHGKYELCCKACNQTSYMTRRGKAKIIDRVMKPCPNCNKVEVTKQGMTDLVVGSYVTIDDFQKLSKNLTDKDDQPECGSTIVSTKSGSKYENPDVILNDPKQLSKFYGEYVKNYYYQIIKENSRKEHKKDPQLIAGPADQILVEEVISLCTKYKVPHNYNKQEQNAGYYHIQFASHKTPPEFSLHYAMLACKARDCNVPMRITENGIYITQVFDAPVIETFVVKPEHVLVLDNKSGSTNDDDEYTVSQIDQRRHGEEKMDADDHVAVIESQDYLEHVRNSLTSESCRAVFDIYTNNGPTYDRFRRDYGDAVKPPINHIADFLDITSRAVKAHINQIRLHTLIFKSRFSLNIKPQNIRNELEEVEVEEVNLD